MSEKNRGERKVINTSNLVADLRKICYTNTMSYREDFEKDAEIILAEAVKAEYDRDTLLWLSYPEGTRCLSEADVFLKSSSQYITWLYYREQHAEDKKLAYAIRIDGVEEGKVTGTLYELDYEEHCKRVEERAVDADYLRIQYEKGSIELPFKSKEVVEEVPEFGKLLSIRSIPNEPHAHHLVVMTERLCRDGCHTLTAMGSRVTLELQWQHDKKKLEKDGDCCCLRCGSALDKELSNNALSRYADLYICSECGVDEALKSFNDGRAINFKEWAAFKDGRKLAELKNMLLITERCDFGDVFLKRDPATRRPVSEAAYSRSDYDGIKWWTKWFLNGPKLGGELSEEIDGFMDALWKMPEFMNLATLTKQASCAAEPTSEPTEFNLYSETLNFYIWIRVITRPKDYNLYVHFYRKDLEQS